jgi:cytoskeletal protein CcmA (bactofilin family)
MPTVLQFRRGTTTQNNAFTGTAGELSVDTTLDTVRVHDGSTAGGFALLKETGVSNLTLNAQAEIRLGDSDSSNYVGFKSPGTVASNLIFTLPSADGSAGQALVTDASGTLSFAAAGATITSDTTTNTDFLLYFASTTSGALTAVKQDSGLIYNPSTGTLTSAEFVGGGVGLTGLNGSNISSGTVAAARVATLNQNTTGTSGGLSSAVTVTLAGAVTGTATFTNAGDTATITTTATSDPTITLAGDLSGAVTLTNLASGTLTATVGTLNQNTTGSAATLTTTRAIQLNGDVQGTVNFDGSANVAMTTTIAANSVALGTDTTGNYVATGAVSGSGLSGSAGGEGSVFTVTSNAASANTANTIVLRDGSGNFTAGIATLTATAARYADLAERYTADSEYDPGTVLIFDGALEVTVSNQDASPKVAGVVSTDPAYLMNSELQGTLTVALALTGRVPTKVVGPVHKGDMMVSTVDGRARAESNPAMGTVIGKALEDFDGTEGTIEVVVGRL